ncbi:TraR/DksA family transcriptional regulator [Ferrimonas balearica]|uniref:TraR/DksA family transcriptional regulator n=1 Tax=Ferrimonas balearica TaxID=44012 RepID=UPI00030BC737|nr:TraR/DksA family transcriptional regulator [Ferrimonas balearica]
MAVLTEAQLAELKARLLQREADSQRQMDELVASLKSRPPCFADAAERADYRRRQGLAERQIQQLQTRLGQIARARARMTRGEYGVCERSGQPIPLARLMAMPEVTTVTKDSED